MARTSRQRLEHLLACWPLFLFCITDRQHKDPSGRSVTLCQPELLFQRLPSLLLVVLPLNVLQLAGELLHLVFGLINLPRQAR